MIVADASVLLEILLRSELGEIAQERLFRRNESIHVPALVDLEVAHVIRRYVRRKEITTGRGKASLDLLSVFPLQRYFHEPLLPRIWELRENMTAYAAAYVALAEALRATFMTCDARLAKASGIRARVDVLG